MRAGVCVCFLFFFASVPVGEAWAKQGERVAWKRPALQLGAGAGAALVTTPLSLWGATALGTVSSNLVLAALPSVVLFAALPPVAVTLAAALIGNHLEPGSSRIGPAMWITVGAQVAILTASILLGASSRNLGDAALITLADVLLLPAVATGAMALTQPAVAPESPIQSLLPPERRLPSLPLVSLAF